MVCFFQVKMLTALGIQSTIFTDGNSPINLFNTAQGLVGAASVPIKSALARNEETSDCD